MATARETLFDEIVALIQEPPGDDAGARIKAIMVRYRVQTKPGVDVPDGLTARDELGDRLLKLWREKDDSTADKVGTEIDKFRMQAKQKSAAKKAGGAGGAKKPAAARPAAARPEARAEAPPSGPSEPLDPLPPRTPRAEPVAGGPRRRGKTRSECPKCHSMGVVLARSYAGDEYYSCIYCGWQAYKPADENDPAASLAGRLLGQSTSKS